MWRRITFRLSFLRVAIEPEIVSTGTNQHRRLCEMHKEAFTFLSFYFTFCFVSRNRADVFPRIISDGNDVGSSNFNARGLRLSWECIYLGDLVFRGLQTRLTNISRLGFPFSWHSRVLRHFGNLIPANEIFARKGNRLEMSATHFSTYFFLRLSLLFPISERT